METAPEGKRSHQFVIGGDGRIKIWYEQTRSSIEGRGPSIRVGAEAYDIEPEDLDEALMMIAQACKDLPNWVSGTRARPRIPPQIEPAPADENTNTDSRSHRPRRLPRSAGRR